MDPVIVPVEFTVLRNEDDLTVATVTARVASGLDDEEKFVEAVKAAVLWWFTETDEGADVYKKNWLHFNIRDLMGYLDKEGLVKALKNEGISDLKVNVVDRVPCIFWDFDTDLVDLGEAEQMNTEE